MGKRDAVRTNSGLPVDHSGPGLRVGPRYPATAERNSAACPPDSDANLSQHKSGWGAGGEAPSDARAASGELRSEATQRGSSLDVIQINRYSIAASELQKRGRKRHCGSRTLRGLVEGQEKVLRLDCRTWGCGYCGPRKAWRYKQAISAVAEENGLNRFLTLTLDPAKIEGNHVRYLRAVFNKFRVYLLRKYGCSIKYIAILEFQQSGVPHLHILLDRFIEQRWISAAWSALGGGGIVDIRHVDIHRVSHYLAKYLTKELLMSAPARSRRITTSRSIHLLEKKARTTTWVVDWRSIFYLFSIFSDFARQIELDREGFLVSFVLPVGTDTPPWQREWCITLTLERGSRNAGFAVFLVW